MQASAPADTPAYSSSQAAHYVALPDATLRSWTGPGGLIVTPAPNILSFNNLAEAHILKAMRRRHSLPMQRLRRALDTLATVRKTAHPLLDEKFSTDGIDLYISEGEDVLNLTRSLQRALRDVVALYLERVEIESGAASKLYPFIARELPQEPRSISISPTVSFGRPVLDGTGISTAVVAGRFAARDSLADLAQEYDVPSQVLEDAIRWEMLKGKAA